MGTLYANFNPSPAPGNTSSSEVMSTTTTKALSAGSSTGTSGEIEFFSSTAHLVHVGVAPDADSAQAFYVFPNFPKRVRVGKGVKFSAKSLV